MNKKHKSQVKLAAQPKSGKASKEQNRFHRFIGQIERQRALLLAWQAMAPRYQQRHAEAYVPLVARFDAARAALVRECDRVYDSKGLTRTQREKLADLISNIVPALLEEHGDFPGLKEIFNKYNEADYDAQEAMAMDEVKDMLEEMFDMEIDDDIDLKDPAVLMRLMAENSASMDARDMAKAAARAALGADGGGKGGGKNAGKNAARQEAKQAQLASDEQNASQSMRDVYRKLASALHPDREPDEAERARKTVLMQRVNVAYAARDLLALLELQLEIEQIDPAAIGALSTERLKHYNHVLQEQSAELAMEIEETELAFCVQYQIREYGEIDPALLLAELDQRIVDMQQDIDAVGADIAAFANIKTLKAWLRHYDIDSGPLSPEDAWLNYP